MSLRDLLINGALVLGGTWLVACVALIVFARAMIYPFLPTLPAAEPAGLPGARAATFTATNGTPVTLWLVPPPAGRPVVIYFTGNAGSLHSHAPLLAELAGQGLGIAAMNYRGAAGAPGKPSEEAITADALALYDRLDALLGQSIPAARRVIIGTSLGAAVAVQLAARREAAALVLESPFNRLCEVAWHHFPIFPTCLLLPYEHWDSAARIAEIDAPLLILHGKVDGTIPLSQGRALFTRAREPKRMIVYPGGGHNDLYRHGSAHDAARFIKEVTAEARPKG